MVPLLLFLLVSVFVGRTNSGVVPQNFKSTHNDPSHLETIFTNNGTNASNLTLENSELHNESSSVLVDIENVDSSHISITDLHNITDLEHVINNITEESHAVKKISTGSARSKKKASKESNKKRESFNKTFPEESDHADTNNVKPTASIEDPGDIHHSDNNVSNQLDRIEHITNNHFDDSSHHSENLTIESDPLNNVSKTFDHDVNKEFNTSVLDDRNHLEDVTSDLNHFNPGNLNNSVVDPLSNVSSSFVHDLNKEFNTSEVDARSHLEDVTSDLNHISPDHLNNSVIDPSKNVSNSFDHAVYKEFNNSVLEDHLEEVTSDSNNFNSNHLNESVVDLEKPLNEVTANVSKELNSTLESTSEINNHSQTISDVPETFERDHFDHMENFQNTSIQLNKAAVSSSKLFLNIHNSFMNLNRTDIPKSPLSDHIDNTSSENTTSIHERNDTAIKDEESFEKLSETENSLESFNSSEIQTDMPSITKEIDLKKFSVSDTKVNGFGHDTNTDIVTATPNEGDVHVSADLPGKLKVNIKKSESLNSDIKEPIVTETNETQGLFSTLGLDFLMNSELAKNAASAMEVFNFSDSALTDHIVDDKNDMHDFLDFIPLVHNDNQSNSDHTPSTSSTIDAESSTIDAESSTIDAVSSTLVTESSTLLDYDEKTFPVIENEGDSTLHSLDVPSSENSSFEVLTTMVSSPLLNSTVEFEVTTLPSQIIFNSTVEYEVTTIPSQFMFNSTVEYEVTSKIPPSMLRNGTELTSEAKCPPPGFCIFWFLGQDTCTVNSHCLGSRICCRIGCTKTCVEV